MTKKELRKQYTLKRESLSENEYFELNKQLAYTFFKLVDLSKVSVLHTFLPMIRKREVDTRIIIDRLLSEHKNVRIAIPRITNDGSDLENFYYEGGHQLMINSWGIQEPRSGEPVAIQDIDLVLVPLLAFDLNGHRVGYGKGYYDKFLLQCRPDCLKIGLSHFGPEPEISDVTDQDFKLDRVISP